MSSTIDHESGEVVITAPVYATMSLGHRLFVAGAYAERSAALQRFEDYLARLAIPRSGRAWGEAVAVKPRDGALLEEIRNGSLHPSLVEVASRADSDNERPRPDLLRRGACAAPSGRGRRSAASSRAFRLRPGRFLDGSTGQRSLRASSQPGANKIANSGDFSRACGALDAGI